MLPMRCSITQMFETDDDENWGHRHPEQPYSHLARAGPAENSAVVYPVENMSMSGVPYASHWNSASMSNGIPSSSHSNEGSAFDPFLHPSGAGSLSVAPESYAHHIPSSNYGGQAFSRVEGDFVDVAATDVRWSQKRKSPGVYETGSSSRYYCTGSSSNLSSDKWQEKPNPDFHHTQWDCPTIGSCRRNVRSRAAADLESNLGRTPLSSNPSYHSHTTGNPTGHSGSVELMGQGSSAPVPEWSHFHMLPDAHRRILLPGSSNSSGTAEIGGYHDDTISSRTLMPQNSQGAYHSVGGVSTQRSAPNCRGAASSNLSLGHMEGSDEGSLLCTESYPSRHPRPLSSIGWRNSDRNERTRISSDRYRSFSDEACLRDRLTSEGLAIVDRSALYGSRNLLDQHREMMLDVDNMSYEELLALGERIGNVSTGLSEYTISKCLTESIYCSSDDFQEEGKCVICLEEYKNMDDVGTLRTCGHDFHVGCIRKWLSMKNLCPICKATAIADHLKEK